jgi:hypothetical protein
LTEAARLLPPTKAGKPVHPSTVLRWIHPGIKAADGSMIKLAARRYPGGWQTTHEAIEAFLDRLTQVALEKVDPSGSPTPTPARQHELDQTDRDLASYGYQR